MLVAQLNESTPVPDTRTDGIIFVFLPALMLYHSIVNLQVKHLNLRDIVREECWCGEKLIIFLQRLRRGRTKVYRSYKPNFKI